MERVGWAGLSPDTDASSWALSTAVERVPGGREVLTGRVEPARLQSTLGATFTVDTARKLKRLYPGVRFVLVMGGDNLTSLRRWKRWPTLFRTLPIVVVSRPNCPAGARFAKPFQRFAAARKAETQALFAAEPPAWTYLPSRFSPLSSTLVRSRGG